MRGIMWALAGTLGLGLGLVEERGPMIAVQAIQQGFTSSAPEAWLQGDPADSLYRSARAALNAGRYREAAAAFQRIRERYPRSGYTPDALYWEAFSLYRQGGSENLRRALRALEMQRNRYARAATRGDGDALRGRINAELARGGDEEAAREVTSRAVEAAEAPEAPVPPETPETPRSKSKSKIRSGECSGDDDTQAIALNALIQMDAERAVPILQRVLARRDPGSECLRRRAMFLVAQKKTDQTEEILLGAARNDPDSEVRQQAVFWLSQVNSDRAVIALDSILRMSRDPELQDKAVFALSQQSSPRAGAALRAFAERDDAPEELREKAIFWMGQKGGSENGAYLRGLYGRLKNKALKEKLLFSISQSSDPESATWLLGIVRNRQEPIDVRKTALFWAGQGKASIADLTRLYDTLDEQEMREQLVFVYSQRREPQAFDKMLDIARRDPDPEIRKKAIFWIGQSKDPRATQFIQELLER